MLSSADSTSAPRGSASVSCWSDTPNATKIPTVSAVVVEPDQLGAGAGPARSGSYLLSLDQHVCDFSVHSVRGEKWALFQLTFLCGVCASQLGAWITHAAFTPAHALLSRL